MMVKIDDAKLENIKGGGYGWIGALIAAVTIFVSGVFEGYTHPKKCSDEKLEEVIGGASVSGTIINAFTNVIKVLIDAGIGVGSAIRRVHDDKLCPLE